MVNIISLLYASLMHLLQTAKCIKDNIDEMNELHINLLLIRDAKFKTLQSFGEGNLINKNLLETYPMRSEPATMLSLSTS